MGDEKHGEREIAPKLQQQIDDLGLDRDVGGGDRLVGGQVLAGGFAPGARATP